MGQNSVKNLLFHTPQSPMVTFINAMQCNQTFFFLAKHFIWRNFIWRTSFGENSFGRTSFVKTSFGVVWLCQSFPWQTLLVKLFFLFGETYYFAKLQLFIWRTTFGKTFIWRTSFSETSFGVVWLRQSLPGSPLATPDNTQTNTQTLFFNKLFFFDQTFIWQTSFGETYFGKLHLANFIRQSFI